MWTLSVGPGDVLDSRNELRHVLGRGAMGEVFLAHDRRFRSAADGVVADVAVKVLRTDLAQDLSFVRRFPTRLTTLSPPTLVTCSS